jgi:hypothetical protein
VSVDFEATASKSMTVEDLVSTSGAILAELVGIDDLPPLSIVRGVKRRSGAVVRAGTPVRDPGLVRIGPGEPDHSLEVLDEAGADLVQLIVSDVPGAWRLVASPRRTGRGVVNAIALALGAAFLGDGEFIDDDLQLLGRVEPSPARFVAATKLGPEHPPSGDPYQRYLRQFPRLEGWPPK